MRIIAFIAITFVLLVACAKQEEQPYEDFTNCSTSSETTITITHMTIEMNNFIISTRHHMIYSYAKKKERKL